MCVQNSAFTVNANLSRDDPFEPHVRIFYCEDYLFRDSEGCMQYDYIRALHFLLDKFIWFK